jgi:hypothetical protein
MPCSSVQPAPKEDGASTRDRRKPGARPAVGVDVVEDLAQLHHIRLGDGEVSQKIAGDDEASVGQADQQPVCGDRPAGVA